MYQNYDSAAEGLLLLLGGFLIVIALVAIAVAIFMIIAMWKIFKKAGKGGWEAIIPGYNVWVLVEIVGLKWWFFFIVLASPLAGIISFGLLAPLAGIATMIGYFFCNYNLARKFEKEPVGFGLGMTFLPIIFYPILAFSKTAIYNKDIVVSGYGPISEDRFEGNKNNNTTQSPTANQKGSANAKFCTSCGNAVDGAKFCSKCGSEIH